VCNIISSFRQPTNQQTNKQTTNRPNHYPTTIQEYIQMLPHLNFNSYPRTDPITSTLIKVNTDYNVRESTKWAILSSVIETNYDKVSIKKRTKYVNSIAAYHSYMGGYCRVVGEYGTFKIWYQSYKEAKKSGKLENVFKKRYIQQSYLILNH
jgi:hypothetical protein